ncbi:DNA helicase-2/ATP-dependent DNA helicase PcrA [Scopulibacillus daqui]|uniref:DNA 3'-5' helicase n=1 Tax=Scopulibacillus daqui TaxID=1469162 RepID=A0ABS2PX07_9BACL|nr:UvrD-helicase domain-containing protein [Scopulibacillus daqui]MBM7644594.1 DNA helicase-2/ATP-dependent DNA helicase PcrA [Scopulibacillus daqui]
MEKQIFYQTPPGSDYKKIPRAEIANGVTSLGIVKDDEPDAFYFRLLEKQNIFLNKPQIEAVRHVNGPVLTLAGAGSGKTSVLISRTGYLINVNHVAPENILLVTFTKKAADEMKTRISRLPGLTQRMANKVQACTFHSFFLTILRHSGCQQNILGSERAKQITIKQILKTMGLQDDYQPETLLSLFSSYKINLKDMPGKTDIEKEQKLIYQHYEKWKKANNKMDFDDILLSAYDLLKRSPALLQSLQRRFKYVMVDEFQDTNVVQYELMKMIVKPHRNFFVVGDDDQTIYSFNGASNHFILNFQKEYEEAAVVTLDINYRSSPSIVGLGNKVIQDNSKRRKKTLQTAKALDAAPKYCRPQTTDEEAEIVISHIKREVEEGRRSFGDFAILHRTASSSRAMFEQLIINRIPFIPYSIKDESFYEHWVVKPVIDYLSLSLDPRDFNAIEGVLPTLYINRYNGMAWIHGQESMKKKKYPLIHLVQSSDLKDYQKNKIKERIEFTRDLKDEKPLKAIRQIRQSFYDKYLEAHHDKASLHKENIKETLDELESSAKRFDSIAAFIRFTRDIAKEQKMLSGRTKADGADAVSLMTIHRSKGLEFPVVFLIGASEGILPHSSAIDAEQLEDVRVDKGKEEKVIDAIEEERRLAYVAITRAKDELYISSPAFYRGQKAEISRFILSPFSSRQSGKIGKGRIKRQTVFNNKEQPAAKKSVSAWICTSSTCIAWQRITSYKEGRLKHKDCPLCGSPMEKGRKII